jgi:hypothetical protein
MWLPISKALGPCIGVRDTAQRSHPASATGGCSHGRQACATSAGCPWARPVVRRPSRGTAGSTSRPGAPAIANTDGSSSSRAILPQIRCCIEQTRCTAGT